MRDKLLLIFIFSCLCFVHPLQAQESSIADMTPEDYAHLELPPLTVLFENAKNNPIVLIQEVKKEGETSLLKKEKRNWLNFFSVGAGYNYGVMGNTSSFSDSATPLYSQYNSNAQHYYHVGGSIGFSIEELFDLKPKIYRQRLKVKEIDLQKELKMDELKQQIIELYTSALSNITILKQKAEALTFSNAQYKIGENEFLNGKGDPGTLNTQKELQTKNLVDYELTRSILNGNLLKLELLTRTPIVNKSKIK